jgi:hypothetical protein
VLDVSTSHQIRLGITTDPGIVVDREEVHLRRLKEQEGGSHPEVQGR